MVLSTKGRYALRLMLNIACHPSAQPVSLREVAAGEDISVKYLEQLASALHKAGLLRAERGAGGGYLLTKAPEQYTVLEILRVMEKDMIPAECVRPGSRCQRSSRCVTQEVWKDMARAIDEVLERWTLADLVSRYNEKCATNM